MSSSRKRPAPHPLEEPTAKHHHIDPIVISDDEDEESLETILAQIKEQDESEALAIRLQQEWNTADTSVASHPVASSSRLPDEDEIMAIDLSDADDDEALTRLAEEWEEIPSDNDLTIISAPLKPTLYGDSSRSKANNFDTSPLIDESAPDQKLRQCSEMFVSDRTCSICQTVLPSPRGHVRSIFPRDKHSLKFS
jgi:baculoviral IAP repeat-containing protein 6